MGVIVGGDAELRPNGDDSVNSVASIRHVIKPATEKRLVWKTDLILMPALGK